MAFPTTSVLDDFNHADEDPIVTNFTTPIVLGDGSLTTYQNRLGGRAAEAYYDISQFGPDCEVYVQLSSVATLDGYPCHLYARLSGQGTASISAYVARLVRTAGVWQYGIWRKNAGVNDWLWMDVDLGYTVVDGDSFGLSCEGDIISFYYKPVAGSWILIKAYDDSADGEKITTAGYIGVGFGLGDIYGDNFGGGTISGVTLDSMLPDADITTTGWSTAPLFSKVNDASDSTVIQATAS